MKNVKTILATLLVVLASWLGYNQLGGGNFNQRSFNLIGTGYYYGGGVASSTAQATIFQFVTSTDTTTNYKDTAKSDYPNFYGNTTTAAFSVADADKVLLDFYYDPVITASQLVYELAYSNDTGCNQASSTLNTANWYPLPQTATTTPWSQSVTTTANAITGFTQPQKFGLLINTDYQCLRLRAYNSSTTDGSLLRVVANLHEPR